MCETRMAIKIERNKLLAAGQNDILTGTKIFFFFHTLCALTFHLAQTFHKFLT
jgi:hypothetical protein